MENQTLKQRLIVGTFVVAGIITGIAGSIIPDKYNPKKIEEPTPIEQLSLKRQEKLRDCGVYDPEGMLQENYTSRTQR